MMVQPALLAILSRMLGRQFDSSGGLLHAIVAQKFGVERREYEVWVLPQANSWEVLDRSLGERRTYNPVHGLLIEEGKTREAHPPEIGRTYPVPPPVQMLLPAALPIWRDSDDWRVGSAELGADSLELKIFAQDPSYVMEGTVRISQDGVAERFSVPEFELVIERLVVEDGRSRSSIWWGV
ncbi:hypothetical protein [Curtobacterium sp. NPDC089689]|uniref:hypothetical protein n=1 Tax=Curtobacterium sp. NPDC089689 TaxID=3363968 RepID=UPI0037F3A671